MIEAKDLQFKLDEQKQIGRMLEEYLLKGPYKGKSVSISKEEDFEKILRNKRYTLDMLKEHGYTATIVHDNSLAGGFDGIPKSIKIEW